jgi:hypothetical protein
VPFVALLDANVLYPAHLGDLLLRKVRERSETASDWSGRYCAILAYWSVSSTIGSALIRRRSSSITTTLPRSSASEIRGSCLNNSLA